MLGLTGFVLRARWNAILSDHSTVYLLTYKEQYSKLLLLCSFVSSSYH
jgi:hypothetical protein